MYVAYIISGQTSQTAYKEIVLGFNFTGKGSIIMGDYKLIYGPQGDKCDNLMWSPLDFPCIIMMVPKDLTVTHTASIT